MTVVEKPDLDRENVQLAETVVHSLDDVIRQLSESLKEGEVFGKPFRLGDRIVIPIHSRSETEAG